MFSAWPTAAKWIAISATVLALLTTGTAAYFGWKSEITQRAQLEMLAKALVVQGKNSRDKRITEEQVSRLDLERLVICNGARTQDEIDCCYAERKCLPLEGRK